MSYYLIYTYIYIDKYALKCIEMYINYVLQQYIK